MCGICGVINFDPQTLVERSTLEAMNQQIEHRGPDDSGFFISQNIGLAMRRLRIIDLQTGHQPLSNEDGTIWIVYNGEIYNHLDLRCDLEARGHHYRTRTDTETIVHLYEEYGKDCVQRLRGMFAFVLWDASRNALFAARDPLGIKPFYYRYDGRHFLFASEIKAMLAHPGVRAELNREILPEYLAFGYLSGSDTFFNGIKKLMPGHILELDEAGNLTINPYWDMPRPQEQVARPKSFYVTTYRELLEQAVKSHLMSDVPLGVFLSGGVDSSAVAALMTKIRKEPIETFSVGYEEGVYSELPYARTVAKHLGSVHHEVSVSRKDFFNALPKLIWQEDEPICWTSSVALYFVAQLAREHVTVVLTGEGSDETLAGYTRYPFTLWNTRVNRLYRALVPQSLRRSLRETLAQSSRLSPNLRGKLKHTLLARDGGLWTSFYFDNFYSTFAEAAQSDLMVEELRPAPGAAYCNSMAYWNKSSGSLINRMLYTDIKTYLVELLMKQDNMSMAASIESRVPFLDQTLVEFTAQIPARFETRGLAGKMVLKEAVKDLLPASILHRKKMGFPTPWRGWLDGPMMDEIEHLLTKHRALARGLLKPESVKQLLFEHRANAADHSERIWRLLNLELWHRVFIDKDLPYNIASALRDSAGEEKSSLSSG